MKLAALGDAIDVLVVLVVVIDEKRRMWSASSLLVPLFLFFLCSELYPCPVLSQAWPTVEVEIVSTARKGADGTWKVAAYSMACTPCEGKAGCTGEDPIEVERCGGKGVVVKEVVIPPLLSESPSPHLIEW